MSEIVVDDKEIASHTFADVIRRTAETFPDPRFRPKRLQAKELNEIYGYEPMQHYLSANSDGTGTKPELAERLSSATNNYQYFEYPAFDALAMVADDVAREGGFIVGVCNALDVNSAQDEEFVAALARGMEKACKAGRFPLINGETAELGYRTPGWGKNHLNWNAVALKVINEKKRISGEKLAAGQPVVAFREKSIRSNGLTDARGILELSHMQQQYGVRDRRTGIVRNVREKLGDVSEETISRVIDSLPGETDMWAQIQLPWHETHPNITRKLITPSTIYAPLIYEAQGGVDGDVNIPIIACAHISGGGVPKKAERMLEGKNLGLHLDAVFPDPDGVPELIELARTQGYTKKDKSFTERTASEQWNRGVGFMCVTENQMHAFQLVKLAQEMGFEAALAGQITNQRAIEWRGETWTY